MKVVWYEEDHPTSMKGACGMSFWGREKKGGLFVNEGHQELQLARQQARKCM